MEMLECRSKLGMQAYRQRVGCAKELSYEASMSFVLCRGVGRIWKRWRTFCVVSRRMRKAPEAKIALFFALSDAKEGQAGKTIENQC